jgi:hypothetical protein
VSQPSSRHAPAALLLVRGDADAVARWLAKGVTPAILAPAANGWVTVAPAGASSLAAPPYDDAATTLLARPVPRRHRPAVGMRVVGPRLLVCVVPDSVTARAAWLAWEPARGLIRPGGLATASIAQLARAAGGPPAGRAPAGRAPAGEGGRHTVEQLRGILHAPQGRAVDVAGELLDVLRLPGAELLTGIADPPGARRVDPQRERVAAFERRAGHDPR